MKEISKLHTHNDLLMINFIYHKFQFSKFHIYFIVRILHAASKIEIAYQEDQLKKMKLKSLLYSTTEHATFTRITTNIGSATFAFPLKQCLDKARRGT